MRTQRPLAGAVPPYQGGQDAEGQVDAGRAVGHGMTGAHRPLAGQAGHRHEPRHALGDLVVAGPQRPRPLLAEAGDAGVDEAGVHRCRAGQSSPRRAVTPGAKFSTTTSARATSCRNSERPSALLQVERQRLVVAAQVLEVRAQPGARARRSADSSCGGRSTVMTRAPQSDSWRTAVGPARKAVRSSTRR